MTIEVGSELLHYRIVEKLGRGGMGEVWVAEDTKLKRKVALKVLPPDLADDPERRARFEREALAVAALNHPNIVTIHAVEHVDDVHFFTMELVDGEPLTKRIPKDGLSLREIFDVAIPLTDALASAHEQGITHRDLKPDNVMITGDGRVKVLDFGLAKLAQGSGKDNDLGATATVTQAGRILGTVSYMSPEQAEGKPVDTRSDVFSLGVLLYQMATGRVPFQGDTPISTITSIMRDNPQSLTDLKQMLPRHLDRVVKRCLAKDPGRRYQAALELRNELEQLKEEIDSGEHESAMSVAARPHRSSNRFRWVVLTAAGLLVVSAAVSGSAWLRSRMASDASDATTAAVAAEASRKKMIAVLPFENLGSADDEYFAAGMTEEITSRLASAGGLGVISRKSAVAYAGSDRKTGEIGRELGVDYVLEGSVRWARGSDGQSRVRITPQLIDVSKDTHLWSEVYDREINDVFEIQSEIAGQVVNHLGATLLGSHDAQETRPTQNLEAYHAFLRGNYYFASPAPTREVLMRAVGSYERAVELDPLFAVAWGRLSRSHVFLYHLGHDVSEERRDAARRALEQAERLTPGMVESHLARAYFLYWGFKDYEPALEEFRLALRQSPNNLEAMAGEAYILRRLARFDETIELLERIRELNPRDSRLRWDLAETLVYARRYAESVNASDESLALQPADNISSLLKASAIWPWKGREGLPEARVAIEASTIDPNDDFSRSYGFWQAIFERRPELALEHLARTPGHDWVRQPEASFPTRLLEAIALEQSGRSDEARDAYRGAVRLLEAEIERTPDDFRLHGALGLAYAGLGRREDAIASAERSVEMMPLSKDALIGPARLWELVMIHARFGEAEPAVAYLASLIEFSGQFTVRLLELDPRLDPIRDTPRYRNLVR